MRKFGIVLFLHIFFMGLSSQASFFEYIPPTTLQIAKKASINQDVEVLPYKTVRVGIGNNNFSSYEWTKASLYGTGEFELYNNKTYIGTYDSNNFINVSMVGKIFVLRDSEDNVIAKVSGPIILKSDFGFIGVKDLKRAGKDAVYRGQLELISTPKDGSFYIVNSLDIEEYLRGVVPNEMPVSFGLEALKSQSIAARNYVLSPRVKANSNYDVVDSVASQVYFGANTERDLSNQAVKETYGQVALYDWNLILAQYSSTAGGYTESYENAFSEPKTKKFPANPKPYLVAKPDYETFDSLESEEAASMFYKSKPKSFDIKSSYYRWTREWNGQEIQDAIQNNIATQSLTGFVKPVVQKGETIGIITGIKVLKRGQSGKIMELEIQTESGNYLVQKELVIRRLFTNKGQALPSANVVFEQEYDENGDLIYVKAYGGGFGHGVGMSQYGAGYMGKELGMTYDKILKHYYSNISIATEPITLSSIGGENEYTQHFWSNNSANLVVDNKYKIPYIDITINGVEVRYNMNTAERFDNFDLSKYLYKGLNTIKFNYPINQASSKNLKLYIELVGQDDRNNK